MYEKYCIMQIFHCLSYVAYHLVIGVVIICCVYYISLVFLPVLPVIEEIQMSLEIGTTPSVMGGKFCPSCRSNHPRPLPLYRSTHLYSLCITALQNTNTGSYTTPVSLSITHTHKHTHTHTHTQIQTSMNKHVHRCLPQVDVQTLTR